MAGPQGSTPPKRPPKPGPNYVWNGKRWVKKAPASGGKPGGNKPPRGNKPKGPPPWAGLPGPSKPEYSDYLDFAPTFNWGGHTWGANDSDAFAAYLRKHGINPQTWYSRHRTAGKVFNPEEQEIYGEFQPELDAIGVERKHAAELWARRMANLTSFSAALMPYLQQVPGAIMGPYREGAAGVQSAGTGLGAGLTADSGAEAAGANAVLSQLGSPQSLEGGDPGAIIAGLGGMEADLMRSSGGGYSAAAAQLPKTASLEQAQMMKDLLSGATEADSGFSDKITQLLHGLPAARAGIRKQQIAERRQQQSDRLAQLKFEADQHYRNAMLAKYNGQEARYRAELKLSQQKQREANMENQGYAPDGSLLPGFYKDAQGRVLKHGTRYNDKGDNPGQADVKTVAQYQDDIDRYIKSMGHEPTTPNPNAAPGHEFDPVFPDYKTAYARLWARFKNNVSTPAGRKALQAAIKAALVAAGVKPAGKKPPAGGG
jgi:hypothetical protein